MEKLQKFFAFVIFAFCGVIFGIDAGNAPASFPKISEVKTKQKKEILIQNVEIAYSLGTVSGAILYLALRKKRRLLFYLAEAFIVIGCALLSWGKKEGEMYLARFMVGLGCSQLTILAPILVSEVWPDTFDVLATAGICYQTGQVLAEFFDTMSFRISLLGIALLCVIQSVLVACSSNLVFEGPPSSIKILKKKRFRTSLACSLVVQLAPIFAGVKLVLSIGPKEDGDFGDVSKAVAFCGAVLAFPILRKAMKLKNLMALSVSFVFCELSGLFFILKWKKSKDLVMAFLYAYIFTFFSSIGNIPTIFVVKSFDPEERAAGVGMVALMTELSTLAFHLIVNYVKLGFEMKDESLLCIYAACSAAWALIICLVQDGGGPELDEQETSKG